MKAKRPRPLRKGHYDDRSKGRFGLFQSQLSPRRTRIAKNAGWYNALGEKIGDGDLSVEDAVRIAASLRKGELFIVLAENALWDLRKSLRGGKLSFVERDRARERAPGRAYVADRAIFVFAPRKRYAFDYGVAPSRRRLVRYYGVKFDLLRRPVLREMLGLRP